MPQLRRFSPRVTLPTLFVGVLCLALPAGADWLITTEHKLIETQGPWTVDGGSLTYTDTAGEKQKVAVGTINLQGSEKLTALKAAKPFVPEVNRQEQSTAVPMFAEPMSAEPMVAEPKAGLAWPTSEDSGKVTADELQVVLYRTSWCGYCQRTSQLLTTLGVAYVEKDIEKDPKATEEYRRKVGSYRSVPVTDIGGRLVKGFKPTLIHQLVQNLKEKQEAAAASQAAASQAAEGPSS